MSGRPNEITLANGKTIVLTNTKVITKLSNNSVASVVNKAEQQKEQDVQQTGKPGGSGSSGSSSDSSSSSGGSGSSGSADGTAGDSEAPARPSAAQEEALHSWLVGKAALIDSYVSRCNAAVASYNATGDVSACDALAKELFSVRAEFGRKFNKGDAPGTSTWSEQFANLWGVYTNLDNWVGHYGDDDVALNNFNAKVAAIAL